MSINRILMKPQGSDVGNALIMTMGQAGYQYGYSRYNATIGEVEGNVQHEGKAVTLVMLCYYSGYLDFAFNIDGVTSGSYNVTVNVIAKRLNQSNTKVTLLTMMRKREIELTQLLLPYRYRARAHPLIGQQQIIKMLK